MIGGVIMVHGDDSGLSLPPAIAPIQVVIVPVAMHKPGVLEKANELFQQLKAAGVRVKVDDSDQSPGWKFAQYEMKGVPLRLEIGPKDIEQGQCVLVRRPDREKRFVALSELETAVREELQNVHDILYRNAEENLQKKTFTAHNHEEFLDLAKNHPGFIKAMWCGDPACEEKLKDETGGVKSRCIPFEEEHIADTCVCCGKPAKHMLYWGPPVLIWRSLSVFNFINAKGGTFYAEPRRFTGHFHTAGSEAGTHAAADGWHAERHRRPEGGRRAAA